MLARVVLLVQESLGLAIFHDDRKWAEVPDPELSRITNLFRFVMGSMPEVEEGRSRRGPEKSFSLHHS
jgi:hypothetical protein